MSENNESSTNMDEAPPSQPTPQPQQPRTGWFYTDWPYTGKPREGIQIVQDSSQIKQPSSDITSAHDDYNPTANINFCIVFLGVIFLVRISTLSIYLLVLRLLCVAKGNYPETY